MTSAVLDACVLYAAPLRDLFMHLTVAFVFQPKWTERIHAEWIANVLQKRPELSRAALERTRELMDRWARDWQPPDHEELLATLTLHDPDDCHVLAAAIAAQAPLIVTFNLRDFPAAVLAPHGVRAVHPDGFARQLLTDSTDAFLVAVRRHRAALLHPPRSVDGYLATLAGCGLGQTSASLAEWAESI